MSLTCFITDLDGTILGSPENWEGLEVTAPLNDSRTARVTISAFDPLAVHIGPLERMLKVYYYGRLVFWGVILKPVWNAAQGTIEINCIDPTIRLKHRYHRYGHSAVDNGYTIDGVGMRSIVSSAIVTPQQLAAGVPKLGILWGFDYTTPGPFSVAQRGENVWDSLINCTQALTGPDFEFVPRDGLGTGNHVVMNTASRIGGDRTASAVFSYGMGTYNLEDFSFEPDGDAVRNYFVTVRPGGERSREDGQSGAAIDKALTFCFPSIKKYGYYQGWESTGADDPTEVLQAKSNSWVTAYAYPPMFCTITPAMNVAPFFSHDFWVGDTIRVQATRGYMNVNTTARVTQVTITQQDAANNSKQDITCVPDFNIELNLGVAD